MDIEQIDPDIRDVIVGLNALPFVRATLFSCAGTGPNSEGKPHNVSKSGAYFAISYLLEKPETALFHARMKAISGDTERAPESFDDNPLKDTIRVYRATTLLKAFRPFVLIRKIRDRKIRKAHYAEEMARMQAVNRAYWDEVRTVVREFRHDDSRS